MDNFTNGHVAGVFGASIGNRSGIPRARTPAPAPVAPAIFFGLPRYPAQNVRTKLNSPTVRL